MARRFSPKYRVGQRAEITIGGLPVDGVVIDARPTPASRTYTIKPDTGRPLANVRECDMRPAITRTIEGGFGIDRDGGYWLQQVTRGWVRVTPQDCRALRWALAYQGAHDAGASEAEAAFAADACVPPRDFAHPFAD